MLTTSTLHQLSYNSMFDLNTIFDGWGTALLVALLGLLGGGGLYAYKHRVTQKQRAGNRSLQKQRIKGNTRRIKQSQKAGDDSEQIQEG